jgi:lipoyl(octanoyl) transferase
MEIKSVKLHDLGQIPYQEAWDFQKACFNEIIEAKLAYRKNPDSFVQSTENHLIFCEHFPVYTLGRNGKEQHLLVNESKLNQLGAEFVKINRGGDITFHGLGQWVVYPIFDLDFFYTDIGRYIRELEEVVIQVLSFYGLQGERSKGESGVWLDVNTSKQRKICALGVHLSHWVTMHGLAFNINNDLSFYNYIVPCGIQDKTVTSLSLELNQKIDMNEVKELLLSAFIRVFQLKIT